MNKTLYFSVSITFLAYILRKQHFFNNHNVNQFVESFGYPLRQVNNNITKVVG